MPTADSKAELQVQRSKLAHSYNELLEHFSSKELHTVGNYTLGRLIGKGSFGKVYLASHKLTNGSKVVLKSAKKDDANLAREIHNHRQFLHPHIARLYEVIVTENLVWLVLEYCPGDELYNYLLRHGPLPIEKVQKIFTQLVGAVAYVHNRSCVHRDLKLENILLDRSENVKLCDFGFTREYDGKANYLQTFCGTVCYSAPEMLKGDKYAAEKVDVWSLGVILFALLVGQLPFDEDDELLTKHKILGEEPSYPDHLPPEARGLMSQMMSKRPLLRPSLDDLLKSPFLRDYAPQQSAILKLQQPVPFSTEVEKLTLERLRGAGVNIDKVTESVLALRCDALAGWWALLLEKEERKDKRKERKRQEKEAEAKSLRRLSGVSIRHNRLTPVSKEDHDDPGATLSPALRPSHSRGRRDRRSTPIPQLMLPELPRLPEGSILDSPSSPVPPPPIEKDPVRHRSVSSARHRPAPPPKERRRSGGSALQLAAGRPGYSTPGNGIGKRKAPGKQQHAVLRQLTTIKHWFKDNAKRGKSPASKSTLPSATLPPVNLNRTTVDIGAPAGASSLRQMTLGNVGLPQGQQPTLNHVRPDIFDAQRPNPSFPAPITPRSSRRLSAGPSGLRGRKSTSSSVSSIRSIRHIPSHSKASSTSSTTNSVHSTIAFRRRSRSPHSSVKVLPATPTFGTFPSNVRLVRALKYEETAEFQSPSTHVFAKRKRTPFRGPHLTIGTNIRTSPGGRIRDSSTNASRSASVAGRGSGEIIQEESEEEDIEEVEAFSPIGPELGEVLSESRFPVREDEDKMWGK